MNDYDLKTLREAILCKGIQIRKLKKSLDGLDNNFIEAFKQLAAIEIDQSVAEHILGITEEDYEKN